MKILKKGQWVFFFSALSFRQKILFSLLFAVFIGCAVFLQLYWYYSGTFIVPAAGGVYREGIIGQPRFINPLYISDNACDRDIIEILFSGLLRYNEKGEIVKDLSQDYSISADGLSYEFSLRENAFWHDGKPVKAEDVVFSVELVECPQYRSPLRVEWLGVQVEAKNEKTVVFRLKKRHSSFLETVAHLKIIPKHVFKDVPPENFPWILTEKKYLQGSGPFKLEKIVREKSGYIKEIRLKRNKRFYRSQPFLKKIIFYFYKDGDALLKAMRAGAVDGLSISDPKYIELLKKERFHSYRLSMPRYFALFFNLKQSKNLNANVRKALNWAINRDEIIKEVFAGQGEAMESPLLYKYYGLKEPSIRFSFDLEKAKELLDKEGFTVDPETGWRRKIIKKKSSLFKSRLKKGSRGSEVKELQKCLARDKSIYPEGTVSGYFGQKTKAAVIRFQEKYAAEILKPSGLKKGTGLVGKATRRKLNEICHESPEEVIPLQLVITTLNKFPLKELAEKIKEQLENVGVKVSIETKAFSELQTEILAERNYQTLLFGNAFGLLLDPFSFWHSSQKDYPGLNITSYTSKEADRLMEAVRSAANREERQKHLEDLQEILLKDCPALFLVRGDFFYFLSPKIKGYETKKVVEPAKRFSSIEKWYLKTKRKWKKSSL